MVFNATIFKIHLYWMLLNMLRHLHEHVTVHLLIVVINLLIQCSETKQLWRMIIEKTQDHWPTSTNPVFMSLSITGLHTPVFICIYFYFLVKKVLQQCFYCLMFFFAISDFTFFLFRAYYEYFAVLYLIIFHLIYHIFVTVGAFVLQTFKIIQDSG